MLWLVHENEQFEQTRNSGAKTSKVEFSFLHSNPLLYTRTSAVQGFRMDSDQLPVTRSGITVSSSPHRAEDVERAWGNFR